MRFWDASAIVPLIAQEQATELLLKLFETDDQMIVWWASRVEILSALNRLQREKRINKLAPFLEKLNELSQIWQIVLPSAEILENAERLLRLHPLRAADALQLSAAIVAADYRPKSLVFVCRDQKLNEAAQREGFETV